VRGQAKKGTDDTRGASEELSESVPIHSNFDIAFIPI